MKIKKKVIDLYNPTLHWPPNFTSTYHGVNAHLA